MENNDRRVWLGNVDSSIKSIDELDPRIFQTTMKLIRLGAKLEIGPGPLPEYGNGIYCTNLTYPEIQELIKKEEVITKEEEMAVDILFNDLCEVSENRNRIMNHASMGINVEDILGSVTDKYEKVIMPRIYRLSPPAKKLLRDKLIKHISTYNPINNVLGQALNDMENPKDIVFGK